MTTPAWPAGIRLESLEVGATPLVRHFLQRLQLPALFERHLPHDFHELRGLRMCH